MPDSSSSRGLLGFGYPLVSAALPSAETRHAARISIGRAFGCGLNKL
jgi:IMP dehydrogenase/GMP reductase